MLRSKTLTRSTITWSLDQTQLAAYVARQLSFFAHRRAQFGAARITRYLPEVQARVEKCFAGIRMKYYQRQGRPVFDHAHGDHYAVFLYFLGNTIFRAGGNEELATACFSLNKLLHGLDAYPAVELPDIFMVVHPLGTVLGGAQYGNHLIVYQNCTIGSADDGRYPVFAGGTVLYSGVSVIGACRVGPDVVFGANSFLLNTDVPARTTVVGEYPQHRFLPNNRSVRERFFE